MEPIHRLSRAARIALLGGLLIAIAALGAACSSDDNSSPASASDAPSAAVDDGLAGRGYAEGARLVTTEWLAKHLGDAGLVVVDLRGQEDYAAGHIPGAVRLNANEAFSRTDDNGVKGQIGLADQVAAALGAAGIAPDSTVVFYDGSSNLWSARALWVLDVYGHAESRILDGAWALWAAESRETSTEAPAVTATAYAFAGAPDSNIIAGFDELVAAVNDPEKLVCDARSAEEYAGRDVRSAQGGHIPGAVNHEWRQAIDDQGQFKAADDLRSIYEHSGLVSDDSKTVYVYCQTGVRAAHTWFVLHDLLGRPSVKNYDGSWEEYGNRTDAPIERS